MAALQPAKRNRQENKYSRCIICQAVSKEPLTKRPQMKSYENILTSCQQRVEYGDVLYSDMNDRLEDVSAEDLATNSAVYHRDCYQKLTNVICLERAKERFKNHQDVVTLLLRRLVLEDQPLNKNPCLQHLKKEFIGLQFHRLTRICAFFAKKYQRKNCMMSCHLIWVLG